MAHLSHCPPCSTTNLTGPTFLIGSHLNGPPISLAHPALGPTSLHAHLSHWPISSTATSLTGPPISLAHPAQRPLLSPATYLTAHPAQRPTYLTPHLFIGSRLNGHVSHWPPSSTAYSHRPTYLTGPLLSLAHLFGPPSATHPLNNHPNTCAITSFTFALPFAALSSSSPFSFPPIQPCGPKPVLPSPAVVLSTLFPSSLAIPRHGQIKFWPINSPAKLPAQRANATAVKYPGRLMSRQANSTAITPTPTREAGPARRDRSQVRAHLYHYHRHRDRRSKDERPKVLITVGAEAYTPKTSPMPAREVRSGTAVGHRVTSQLPPYPPFQNFGLISPPEFDDGKAAEWKQDLINGGDRRRVRKDRLEQRRDGCKSEIDIPPDRRIDKFPNDNTGTRHITRSWPGDTGGRRG
ncbi:hypothetical protein C7M84_012450 [Penaeus vannamei]|uniref:Uncharacterized protein n=1 Tax=Penaeus vannamei TaxID=6689 RepID=A0A3R7SPC8_PENVA|nr:hypothetical protein C7M84_012450 [Penaeus vannamei]